MNSGDCWVLSISVPSGMLDAARNALLAAGVIGFEERSNGELWVYADSRAELSRYRRAILALPGDQRGVPQDIFA